MAQLTTPTQLHSWTLTQGTTRPTAPSSDICPELAWVLQRCTLIHWIVQDLRSGLLP